MLSKLFNDPRPGKHMRFIRGELFQGRLMLYMYRSPNDLKPYHTEDYAEKDIPKKHKCIYNWLINRKKALGEAVC